MNYNDDRAAALIKDYECLANDRSTLESHWQEIAERIIPAHSKTFMRNGDQGPQGQKKTEMIFDSTAAVGLGRFGSIVDSLITPRNSTWHKLASLDKALVNDRDTKLYLDEVVKTLFRYRYSPKANFASQNQQNYESLGAFGTGCMYVDMLPGGGLRYKNVHLSEIYFRENHQGMVDTAFRHFQMTARQAAQKFGEEKLPDSIKAKLKNYPDTKYFFLHVVKPREDMDPTRLDYKGKAFESVYISIEGKVVLDEGGYDVFPYAISRYKQSTGETYGRSPAMDVLPAIKTLNEQKKTVLKQGHRAVDPIILVHDDGVADAFSLKPGTIVPGGVDANGRPLATTLPVGNVMIGKELMDDERLVINDAFLVTLFQILTETPAMTATEVLERTKEKGILMAPTLGRQQSEYLGQLIEIEVDLLSRQGLLPPMPQSLKRAGGHYEIVYDSPLSRAAKAEEAAGAMRAIETAMNIMNVTQDPSILDPFNMDVIIPEIAEINGMPERWKRDPDEIAAMREQRSAANQQQAEVEAAPGAAAMMNAATKSQQVKP